MNKHGRSQEGVPRQHPFFERYHILLGGIDDKVFPKGMAELRDDVLEHELVPIARAVHLRVISPVLSQIMVTLTSLRHFSSSAGTPSLGVQLRNTALIRRFAISVTSSILAPRSGNHGNMTPANDRTLPEREGFGVHSSTAFLTLGSISWSRMLSRIKGGRIGDHDSSKTTAECG